jgi:hypothetical protein
MPRGRNPNVGYYFDSITGAMIAVAPRGCPGAPGDRSGRPAPVGTAPRTPDEEKRHDRSGHGCGGRRDAPDAPRAPEEHVGVRPTGAWARVPPLAGRAWDRPRAAVWWCEWSEAVPRVSERRDGSIGRWSTTRRNGCR